MDIMPFKISHDAVDPVGFCIYYKDKKISCLTDCGFVNDDIIKHIKNSDIYHLESNHNEYMLENGTYPYRLKKRVLSVKGHLSNKDASVVLSKVLNGGEQVVLAHLSDTNNTEQIAYAEVCNFLKTRGINPLKDIKIDIAKKEKITREFIVK